MEDRRKFAPATERNREPLLQVLRRVLPHEGVVLELASGTGEHAMFFARYFPRLEFQPSDHSSEALESIEAWRQWSQIPNVRAPILLDVNVMHHWTGLVEAMICINMLHIAPWSCTEALFRGAARHLKPRGNLLTYGPYRRAGTHTAPSNAAFDESLRAQNPAWGVRDVEAVEETARDQGLELVEVVAMPANNLALCFRKKA